MESLFWEDYTLGKAFDTPSRTIFESDVRQFVSFCGLYEPLFMDADYATSDDAGFGRLIAPGIMTLSYSIGLGTLSGFTQRSGIAFLGLDAMRAHAPVAVGDTIHVRIEPISKRETKRPDRGIVVLRRSVYNQRDELVLEYETTLMARRIEASTTDRTDVAR